MKGTRSLATCLLFAALLAPRVEAQTAAQRLQLVTLFDSTYHRPRRIWIHTPRDYDARRARPYPLVLAFDGADYRDTIPLPLILDTLQASGRIPPVVAVLVDDSTGAVRIGELGNARKMVDFLAAQLLPYVRAHWNVTSNPQQVLITGSSAGGLAAAFVALERPDLFGNVLSQSGAFWRGAEASNSPPYEWLAQRVAQLPPRAVRFWLDVGQLENRATLGGAGPIFIEANRRFRAALIAKGYSVTYTEVPGGRHDPIDWSARLPYGIAAVSSGWR